MISQLDETGPITKVAELSDDFKYRYQLRRHWRYDLPMVLWVMLNPSTADGFVDDRTISKCIRYAKDWGHGGIAVVNLFAYRATDPKELKALTLAEAVGPENDSYLFSMMATTQQINGGLIVAGWGQHGKLHGRAAAVKDRAQRGGIKLHALRLANDGSPYHPLYLKSDLRPFPME